MTRKEMLSTLDDCAEFGNVSGDRVTKFVTAVCEEIDNASAEGRAEDYSTAITYVSYE